MSMIFVLFLIPIFTLTAVLTLYRFVGKKEVFKIDLVQFIYIFVISPVLFVWLKSFLYQLLKSELNLGLSTSDLLIIDTSFSVIFLYVYAFVTMHGLTKSFNLKMSNNDPLYDLFYHSEYIHLWLTHIAIFVGAMSLFTLISIVNLFTPLLLDFAKGYFYLLCALGSMFGAVAFVGIWAADPEQENAHFMRLMKLAFAFFFVIHILFFFVSDPDFNEKYLFYWFSLFGFATTVVISLFVYKSVRAKSTFQKITDFFKHEEWDYRRQLFKK